MKTYIPRFVVDGRIHPVGPHDLDATKPPPPDDSKTIVRLRTKDGREVARNLKAAQAIIA